MEIQITTERLLQNIGELYVKLRLLEDSHTALAAELDKLKDSLKTVPGEKAKGKSE